jgi:hypothetical protein
MSKIKSANWELIESFSYQQEQLDQQSKSEHKLYQAYNLQNLKFLKAKIEARIKGSTKASGRASATA